MLTLVGLPLPLAIIGFAFSDNDDDTEDTVEVVGDNTDDTLTGGPGADVIDGGAGDNAMNGRAGADTIFGCEGADVLQGEDGDNTIIGSRGIYIVERNDGDDLIIGSMDLADGGFGANTFHLMSDQVGTGEALIVGYSADVDAITVLVDDTSADADISVPIDGEDALVSFGDVFLARIEGAAATLTAANISLVSYDTAASLFDPHPAGSTLAPAVS